MRIKIKIVSVLVLSTIIFEILFPTVAFALTSGPSQPEVQSFEPIGTSEMVEISSGDFVYNIPLLDVGGYPINLSYHSGITMDQEASWVGLGWNINPGVINRGMRSLPDDFQGEIVKKEYNIKANETTGFNAGAGVEFFGLDFGSEVGSLGLELGLGINYNNYKGIGMEVSIGPSVSITDHNSSKLTAGLGLSMSSHDGATLSPSYSFGKQIENADLSDRSLSFSVGTSVNTRAGMRAINIGAGISGTMERNPNSKSDIALKSSMNGNASLSFASPTYVPQIQMPMRNFAMSFSAKGGGETPLGVSITGNTRYYFSKQELSKKSEELPAFGYMFSHAQPSEEQPKALLDFNREKDIPFTKNTPALPLSNFTYDVYSVSGQGIGATYRPFRSDVGELYDSYNINESDNFGGGLELGFGGLAKVGGDVDFIDTRTETGRWRDGNYSLLGFLPSSLDPSDKLYEPYYFKNVGEKTADPDNFLNRVGGDKPVRVALDDIGMEVQTKSDLVTTTDDLDPSGTNALYAHRKKRQRRNQNITILNAAEATNIGLEKSIVTNSGFGSAKSQTSIARSTGDIFGQRNRKSHHISEITATREDGARYVYGIAAYNNFQKEATFNVSGNANYECSNGLIPYYANDNTSKNTKGIDNYFSSTELPAYAHSYFLTAILSPDYVDVTDNGPTADDLGTYTKINYDRVHENYKWRVPLDKANYNEGFKSNKNDDKGSYIYGEKEYWYIHSIETKNYIAEFILGNREDGLGVSGENGGKSTAMQLKKLEKIILYSKPDRQNNPNPVPIKTVHFEYSYELCGKVPNNSERNIDQDENILSSQSDIKNVNNKRGKLTLKKVYFSYGHSQKAKLSAYKFTYDSQNPDYNFKGYDRWGNYKENKQADVNNPNACNELSNSDFPYVEQDKAKADLYTSAWCLTKIKLPSGGAININYESDDYAFVQNRRAMQMFKVTGIGNTDNPTPNQLNGGNTLYSGGDNNNFIYFKLDKPIPDNINAVATLSKDYIGNIYGEESFLYFKFFIALSKEGDYEYVPGYVSLNDFDFVPTKNSNNEYTHAFVKVEEKSINDRRNNSTKVNPIARTAWQYARLNLPRIAYGESDVSDNGLDQIISGLASMVGSVEELFKGFNRKLRSDGYGRIVDLNKSVIRLYNPNKVKYGGGSRVKLLTVSDEWGNMTTNNSAQTYSYGQSYDYSEKEYLADGSSRFISTGVASYEPMVGGDENPFRTPEFLDEEYVMAPDNEHYLEQPFGESFFPSPSVVYSKISVKSVAPGSTTNSWRSANTGHIEHEFYTAKDFPVFPKTTRIKPIFKKNNPILRIFNIVVKDYVTATQGYVVELNDMHGKPKGQKVFAENNPSPISEIKYEYYTNVKEPNKLDNNVLVIDNKGTRKKASIGVDFDMISDARESSTLTHSNGILGNLDVILALIVPIPIPVILPSFSEEHNRFRSLVTTKVINKYGILKKTTVIQDGAKIETENVAFDEETGEVLLTKTQNEYKEDLYNLTYPAHWAYDRMGPAYKNIDFQLKSQEIVGHGKLIFNKPNEYFVPGDEILLDKINGNSLRAWVLSVSGSDVQFINREGKYPETGTYNIRIVRSGRRNQQTASIGSVTLKADPFMDQNKLQLSANKNILNASATEYSENWQTICSDVQSGTTTPILERTQEGTDLMYLLNQLATANKLNTNGSGVYLGNRDAHSSMYDKYTSILRKALQTNKSHYWVSSLTNGGTILNGYISDRCAGTQQCNITLKGNNLISVTSFGELTPIYSTTCTTGTCPLTTYYFTIEGYINNTSTTIPLSGSVSCYPVGEWKKNYAQGPCEIAPESYVNPYVKGILGNWRPQKSHLYLTDRSPNSITVATNAKNDGIYKDFSAFWAIPGTNDKTWKKGTDTRWKFTTEVTKYDPYGNELESQDALGRYSSGLMGYNHSLVTAMASNSKYRQIAFDNFEDYNFADKTSSCDKLGHWDFTKYILGNASIVTTERHTGKYSILVPTNGQHYVNRSISSCGGPATENCVDNRRVKQGDCSGRFNPCSGKYVVSGWVKESNPVTPTNYEDAHILVELTGPTNQSQFIVRPKGTVIEGWQRIFETIEVPSWATNIKVTLVSGTTRMVDLGNYVYQVTQNSTYFDDIRIHPIDGNMKSYVYDPVSLKLSAILDENNYATLYEYDEEGALTRVKKETKDGIYTIQETRTAKFKQ